MIWWGKKKKLGHFTGKRAVEDRTKIPKLRTFQAILMVYRKKEKISHM